MRSTYKQLYYINRGKVKSDGTTSIMCRITIDGKAVALSTGLYCYNRRKGCCIIDRVILPAGRVEQQERRSQKQQTERNAL